jgi:hypothetical protein
MTVPPSPEMTFTHRGEIETCGRVAITASRRAEELGTKQSIVATE